MRRRALLEGPTFKLLYMPSGLPFQRQRPATAAPGSTGDYSTLLIESAPIFARPGELPDAALDLIYSWPLELHAVCAFCVQ